MLASCTPLISPSKKNEWPSRRNLVKTINEICDRNYKKYQKQ